VLYFLLAGRDIFVNDSSWELDALADIANASCGVELPLGVQASHAARDFLRRCLERDPNERASAKELMQHPWLMGASSYSDMQAFHAAQARVNSYQSSVQRTALLSVLAESFSSEDDDNCSVVNQPISLAPAAAAAAAARAAAAMAAAQAADDPLAASLALASGVTDLDLEQQQLHLPSQPQQLQQQPVQQLDLHAHRQQQQQHRQHRHRSSNSMGGSHKSLQAAEEVAATAAGSKELQKRAGGEAVCEVRLKMSQSGASLPSAGSVPHIQTVC
jgi:serine/threonine protein kinase